MRTITTVITNNQSHR